MFQATAPASPTYIMTNGEGSRSNKRNSTEINFGKTDSTSELNPSDQNFCLGVSIFIQHFSFYDTRCMLIKLEKVRKCVIQYYLGQELHASLMLVINLKLD